MDKSSVITKVRTWLHNLADAKRQRDINRLVTRAGRRVTRDLRHALDEVPEDCPHKKHMLERLKCWQETFWDTALYRDSLHQEIMMLEMRIETLTKRLNGQADKDGEFAF